VDSSGKYAGGGPAGLVPAWEFGPAIPYRLALATMSRSERLNYADLFRPWNTIARRDKEEK
jgi:hypothetical protein